MIELELPQALAVYSILLGLLVVGIWLYTELSVRRPQRRLGRQFLWKCTFCGCTYLDEHAEQLSQCPRCENYNTAEEAAAFGVPDPLQPAGMAAAAADTARNTSRRKRRHQRSRGPRRRR